MSRIGIVTEETVDFPLEFIDRHGIAIVPGALDMARSGGAGWGKYLSENALA